MENRNILFEVTSSDLFAVTEAHNSHRPLLKLALEKLPTGTMIELGMGYGSTLILASESYISNRRFLSYENNPEWFKKMTRFQNENNNLRFVGDWDKVNVEPCEILFIDHAPGERRKIDIERFRNEAKVIIIHDTEPEAEYVYGLKEILGSFKYRYDLHVKGMPSTTAVSEETDITKWKHNE